jgi:hypothetical protein
LRNQINAGYTAGAEALSAVSTFIAKIKQEKPDLIYLLDRAFVPADIFSIPCSTDLAQYLQLSWVIMANCMWIPM